MGGNNVSTALWRAAFQNLVRCLLGIFWSSSAVCLSITLDFETQSTNISSALQNDTLYFLCIATKAWQPIRLVISCVLLSEEYNSICLCLCRTQSSLWAELQWTTWNNVTLANVTDAHDTSHTTTNLDGACILNHIRRGAFIHKNVCFAQTYPLTYDGLHFCKTTPFIPKV